MKNLKEAEKNFLTCAILIALVGIALIFLDQTTLGICSNLFEDGGYKKERGKWGREKT